MVSHPDFGRVSSAYTGVEDEQVEAGVFFSQLGRAGADGRGREEVDQYIRHRADGALAQRLDGCFGLVL